MQKLSKDKKIELEKFAVQNRKNVLRLMRAGRTGHIGGALSSVDIMTALYFKVMRVDPQNPDWSQRDRFVLSAGHGSMLLYSLLHLTGYDLSLDELKNFRQWGSKTPGHPESHITKGVETTTGPLGQGFANGVGMAIAERYLAAHFNRAGHNIVGHHIYGIVSDGDLMEGVSHEAASLAGHLKLGNIIYFYDDNHISIDGSTDLAFTENRVDRFKAYGWHVQRVEDGNDIKAIDKAIQEAQEEKERPSLISARTHIGYGSPNKQDTASAHGEPLGAEELKLTKENLGWPLEPEFLIPEEALKQFRQALEKGKAWEEEWTNRFQAYEKAHPELAAECQRWMSGQLPDGWTIHPAHGLIEGV